MPIYYCYEKNTGKFAGSGINAINNDTHESTEIIPDALDDDDIKSIRYNKNTNKWDKRVLIKNNKIILQLKDFNTFVDAVKDLIANQTAQNLNKVNFILNKIDTLLSDKIEDNS